MVVLKKFIGQIWETTGRHVLMGNPGTTPFCGGMDSYLFHEGKTGGEKKGRLVFLPRKEGIKLKR